MTKSINAKILLLTFLSVCGVGLSSCATSVFDPRACPNERKYTKAEQQQLLDDMPTTPQSIQSAMIDYGKLRDKARACRGEKVR